MNHDLQFSIRLKRALLLAACLSSLCFPFPTRVAAQTVTRVSANSDGYQCLFIESDGSLWGTGLNNWGQLGVGSALGYTNLPQLIVAGNVSAVAAGTFHSLFVESNQSLWAMGLNAASQLGDGTTNNQYFPEQIESSEVTGVAAGGEDSLFTTFSGGRFNPTVTLWGMGATASGDLGSIGLSHTPQQIQSSDVILDEVAAVTAGYDFTFYIREDGSLWASGDNEYGQLGDGTQTSRGSFEEILSSNVTAVAAGTYHSLFIKSDGSLWAMGWNTDGQLGDGSTNTVVSSPEPVGTNVIAVAAGLLHSLFIKSDGSLWGMGANVSGQLGDGTSTNQPVPIRILASNVVAIAAGTFTSYFIKSDGTLWAMGENDWGELGDGSAYGYASRHYPVQIVPLVIPQPAITNISVMANTNLVLSGTNGESGRNYFTLMSTNLTLPLSQWAPVATNFVTTDPAFTITATNAVNPNAAQAFYVLQAQAITTGP